MKNKSILIVSIMAVIILSMGYYFYNKNNQPSDVNLDQQVYKQTLIISKEYTSLRYQTDNFLMGIDKFSDYDTWKSQMTTIIQRWNDLEKNAASLEQLAQKMADDKLSKGLISEANAYDSQEVNSIFQNAPNGKKITTLAKHLGVDAKMAQLILNQTQDYSSREAYGGEGDSRAAYEKAATTIKNTSKVTVFVGTIAISAPVGILAKTAVIVSGADLTLEITDDTAKMALGNQNKISAIAGDVRKITEPAAAILSIANLPNKLVEGVDKLNAVVFGADQLNSAIQAGSVIGIKLPVYTANENTGQTYEVSVLESDEVEQWIKDKAPDATPETVAEIEKILGAGKVTGESSVLVEEGEKEATESNKPEETQTNAVTKKTGISITAFDAIIEELETKFDYDAKTDDYYPRSNQKGLRESFGAPDLEGTTRGYSTWAYYDLIKVNDEASESVVFTFLDNGFISITKKMPKEQVAGSLD